MTNQKQKLILWRTIFMKERWIRAEAAEKASRDLADIWFGKKSTEAQLLVPDWVDKVDSGIGLSYWPARLHM